MKIADSFEVPQPREAVWALFQDVPGVARCIPGTEITADLGEGRYQGRVQVRLGPIATAFEGDASHLVNALDFAGTITGNGRDRGTGSRAKFTTTYRLSATPAGTRVDVESDVSLAGAVAQFGRTGLMQEVTSRMLAQFVANLETRLASTAASTTPPVPQPAPPVRPAEVGGILWSSLWAWLRSWVRRLLGQQVTRG
ncbi:MAG: SRPBCC family protein [Gammaproteobacteria bacterium]